MSRWARARIRPWPYTSLETEAGHSGPIYHPDHLRTANSFKYEDIWASVALLTGVSVLLYNLIAIAESTVLALYSLREAS